MLWESFLTASHTFVNKVEARPLLLARWVELHVHKFIEHQLILEDQRFGMGVVVVEVQHLIRGGEHEVPLVPSVRLFYKLARGSCLDIEVSLERGDL